jgi:hypothetical protein
MKKAFFCLFFCALCAGCGGGPDVYQGECPPGRDCSLPGVAMVFELQAENFFNLPWPADPRKTEAGTIDVSGFPNPSGSSLLGQWLELIGENTTGFGTYAAGYFTFSGRLSERAGALRPADTLAADSPVFLVDISDGPSAGERIPLEVSYYDEERQFTPAYTLALRPSDGFPLRSSTTYALVVRRELRSLSGLPLGASADFERTKYTSPPRDERLLRWWRVYQPAYERIERIAGVGRGDIAALAVFTTQPVVEEMDRVRDFIASFWEAQIGEWQVLGRRKKAQLYQARITLPQFQAGLPPDFAAGGGFVFDSQGRPVVQRSERVGLTLAVPDGEEPAGGWPLVLYHHGTGGDRFSFCSTSSSTGDECDWLAEVGVASAAIDQPLHGERNTGGWDEVSVTFNGQNPEAFRDNFRQGAAELLVLEKVAASLEIPAQVAVSGRTVRFDPGRLAFMGHSQGGITGPIFLGSSRRVRGAMLSASGGGLGTVILERKNPVDIRALLVLAMGLVAEELDLNHPVISLFQTYAERADPINYARRFLAEPEDFPRHLLFTEGLKDEMTMPVQIENLAAAAGCAPLEPVARLPLAMSLRGVKPVARPGRGNARGPAGEPVTALLAQFPEEGHFAIYDNADARKLVVDFLQTLLYDPPPTVGRP